jgi:hypothetical protein
MATNSGTKTATLERAPREPSKSALTSAERALLTEALERAETVRKNTEEAVVELGRWLFSKVFGEDSRSALEHREDNPVWSALAKAADGPRLRLQLSLIESSLLCAAYDKRLNSDSWRALDFGRKARLLRLHDEKALRRGAQHVLAANLTLKETEAYVRSVRAELGEPAQTRASVPALRGALDRLSERVGARGFVRQVEQAARKLDDDDRAALLESIERAKSSLDELATRVKKS